MDVRVLVFGAGGDVWTGKIEPALSRLKDTLANEGRQLAVWGANVSGQTGNSSLVDRWFHVDVAAEMTQLLDDLRAGAIQVAVIASPNETHVSYLSLLIGKVRHVVVEKPLAEEVIEADLALILAQSDPHTTCRGLEHYVAKPWVRAALRMAQSGELLRLIGETQHVHFSMREANPIKPDRARTLNRGLAFDMAIHGFAFLLRLFDRHSIEDFQILQASAAKYRSAPIEGETAARIELAVQGGPTCTIDIGKGLAGNSEKWIVIRGSKDSLIIDLDGKTVSLASGALMGSLPDVEKCKSRQVDDDAYDVVLNEPIRMSCRLPVCDVDSGWSVSIALAANALKLVEQARDRFDASEPYAVGTLPRIFSRTARLGGADVEVCQSKADLERAALRLMLDTADSAIRRFGNFVLVIAGGTSLLGATSSLTTEQLRGIDLSKWQIFFSDEHTLPHEDAGNNYWLAETRGGWGELIRGGRLVPDQLHRIVVEDKAGNLADFQTLKDRARQYTNAYRSQLGSRKGADLAFLGLGTDCHTASLIPQKDGFANPLLRSSSAFDVVEYSDSYQDIDHLRTSITPAGIADVRKAVLIAFGKKKSAALQAVLTEPIDLEQRPGSVVRLVGGSVLTDAAGASCLPNWIVCGG